ncbi:MAG: RsmB/NOP family class I SAM-dependent RNA methyltransferase [Clostridia bacterium]|nr:RsmB/NOP family class I SAM-dependent RNA methyltransferase [Clostridia bacterium]
MEDNFYEFLTKLIQDNYDANIAQEILSGYNKKRATTFRVNTNKTTIEDVIDILKSNEIDFNRVLWSKEAFILNNGKETILQELEIYKEGQIYLQSLSSMIPAIVLDPKPKENILDMCSAPGGKTTQMATLSNNQAYITACERNPIRAEKLKYNIQKQGCKGTIVMTKDARDLDDMFSFDKILLDAPCSGSGTLYLEDESISKYFTKELITKSVKTQTALVKKAIKLLKPGGELVYSTCSILKEENENIINNILRENNNLSIIPIEIKDIPTLPCKLTGTLLVKPNEEYEGFYVARIKKEN